VQPDEAYVIREYRITEINALRPDDRGPAWMALKMWRP
jgi:hypothetical protein